MGMKTGLVVGFGIGYVLGSRAGRQRYEELQAWWGRLSGSPAMQKAADNAKSLAGGAGRKGMEAVQGGVTKVAGAVKNRLGDEGSGTEYAVGT
ncbi:MAG TPA: YtxH domain-containing protein [Actinomycetota bacterium]|nr:YtxH domain-containing protein [Actinomycetota bacterium]